MPTNASTVGAVQFPVDASVADTALRDPVKTTLLHLAAHWLNFGIGAKLDSMEPTKALAIPTSTGASTGLPLNLGEFDPGTAFVRFPLPALYCWYVKSEREEYSMVRMLRTSEYHMRYYFSPLTMPQGRGSRSSLIPDVDRLMHRMSFEMRHRTFPSTLVQAVLPVTIPLNDSIEKALCCKSIKLLRSISGTTWESPGQSSTREGTNAAIGDGTDGAVQRGFPTLHCVWEVKEFVGPDQADPVQDETPDLQLAIRGLAEEPGPPVDIMTRNLNAPDGTDSLKQKDEF